MMKAASYSIGTLFESLLRVNLFRFGEPVEAPGKGHSEIDLREEVTDLKDESKSRGGFDLDYEEHRSRPGPPLRRGSRILRSMPRILS